MDRRSRTLCWVGLVFSSPSGADVGDEREVHVHRVLAPHVLAELTDGLEEGQALDVADRAANLHEHDVHVAAHRADAVLDLVGDMGNDLNGPAQVIAAPLLLEHRHVDLAGRPVVVARRRHAGEALVVAQVEVGLRAVVGHVHFAVLIRAHGARVDVDVWVELLQRHLVAMALEQRADRRGGQALAQRRDDAAGDEDVPGGSSALFHGSQVLVAASMRWRTCARSSAVSTPTESWSVSTT